MNKILYLDAKLFNLITCFSFEKFILNCYVGSVCVFDSSFQRIRARFGA